MVFPVQRLLTAFIVDNTGDTILDITVLDDADLGINLTAVTFKSGDTNSDDFVDVDETWTYYYEGSITGDLTNTAEVPATRWTIPG